MLNTKNLIRLGVLVKCFMISGRLIIPKSELISHLVTDRAFGILRKSGWNIEMIIRFMAEKGKK